MQLTLAKQRPIHSAVSNYNHKPVNIITPRFNNLQHIHSSLNKPIKHAHCLTTHTARKHQEYMHTLFRYIHIHLHTCASHITSVYVKCKQSTQITTGNWVRSRNRKPQRNDDDNGVLASKPWPRPARDGGRRRRRHQQCRPLTTAGRRQGSTISPYTGTTANHSQTNRADGQASRQ